MSQTLDRVAAVLPSPLMQKPATARWDLEVSATDVTQLKLGFAGSNQDHKWTIAANDLDDNGLVPIHIIQRGWSADRYILHLKPASDDNGPRSSPSLGTRHRARVEPWPFRSSRQKRRLSSCAGSTLVLYSKTFHFMTFRYFGSKSLNAKRKRMEKAHRAQQLRER